MKKNTKISFALLILLIVLTLVINNAIAQTENPPNPDNEKNSESNPYGASVRITMKDADGGTSFCSGTLINLDKEKGTALILTAGHCVQIMPNEQQPIPGMPFPGNPQPFNPYNPYNPFQPFPFNPYQQYNPNNPFPTPQPRAGNLHQQFLIDFGPGTRQVPAEYVSHEFDYAGGTKDIALLKVLIDISDPPYSSKLVNPEHIIKIGDNVFDIGYPGGEDISVVGCKIVGLTHEEKGPGFSVVNFPPRGGRSGGGLFYTDAGQGKVYEKGNIFGIMTNVDPNSGTGIFSNNKQIYEFLNKQGIKTE